MFAKICCGNTCHPVTAISVVPGPEWGACEIWQPGGKCDFAEKRQSVSVIRASGVAVGDVGRVFGRSIALEGGL